MKNVLSAISLLFLLACASTNSNHSSSEGSTNEGRNFETLVRDESIELKAIQSLFKNEALWKNSSIEVVSFNKTVLLVGQTPTNQLKKQAESLVKQIDGIKKVYNEIRVTAPTSSMVYMSDSAITSKVKAALMLEQKLPASQIKIITEDSEVFLLGIVTKQQAELAIELARNVSGVKRVIQAFEVIH